MDAKLVVATDGGNVKKLKVLLLQNEEDAMAMVGLAATSKKPSKEEQSPTASINPLLLASAQAGSWEKLNALLERDDAQHPPMEIPTQEYLELLASGSSAQGRVAARDEEEGVDHQPAASLAAGALLKGVTPDGDTALHAVARSYLPHQLRHFLKYAGIIYDRDRALLFEKNHKGDTPLHCAAQVGNFEMASHLIDLAGSEGADRKLALLRMENKRHETALHEAVRIEYGRLLVPNKDRGALFDADFAPEERIRAFVDQQEKRTLVKLLMDADPELANYPKDGISPLYLAILLEKSTIALTLYCKSGGNLSYSGADGQNALHVAVLRDPDTVMIELLVQWKISLSTLVDKDGSTPLHFAASRVFKHKQTILPFFLHRFISLNLESELLESELLMIVYKANRAALYQADKDGFFPIHVAASVGYQRAIEFFKRECPNSVVLRDAKGRTFLHVAVEKGRAGIVSYVCRSLVRILHMQDNDGNTAMHLALKARSFWMFLNMFTRCEVNMNLTNNDGETYLDVSRSNLPFEMAYTLSPENQIYNALLSAMANHGALRRDKIEEKYSRRLTSKEQDKESDKLKDATQTLIVVSVLIATVAFSATFALPGGYRADDHTNGGTPTLAGSYAFDAYMMANALGFTCSTIATVGFAFAAAPMFEFKIRKLNFVPSLLLLSSSLICMTIAFMLGVYMVLAPVARNTAIAVCVIAPAVLFIFINMADIVAYFILKRFARPFSRGAMKNLAQNLKLVVVFALWPFLVIFGWAALARILHHR